MAKVYSAIDSIRTKAKISMFVIAPAAPGLRAMPSEAAVEALACAIAQAAEAMAIAKPEVMATHCVGSAVAAPDVWANAPGATKQIARIISK